MVEKKKCEPRKRKVRKNIYSKHGIYSTNKSVWEGKIINGKKYNYDATLSKKDKKKCGEIKKRYKEIGYQVRFFKDKKTGEYDFFIRKK